MGARPLALTLAPADESLGEKKSILADLKNVFYEGIMREKASLTISIKNSL